MKNTGAKLFLSALIASQCFAVLPLSAVELAISSEGASLRGLTTGGFVAWLAVSREPLMELDRVIIRRTVEPISPGLTEAVLTWQGPVPAGSVFVAVELSSGQAVTGSPYSDGLRFGNGGRDRGEAPGVVIPGQSLQILVVRAAGFVWHGAVADGAPEDLDGVADGAVSFDLTTLTAVADAPVAATLGAGDRIWAIDLDSLVLHEITMGGGAP